jgi:serine/threonine protein phosphatase PrpC
MTTTSEPAPTTVAAPAPVAAPTFASENLRAMPALRTGWQSDVGKVREHNEDALIAMTCEFEQGENRQSIGLFAVADGMGGQEQGENASSLAARTVSGELLRQLIAPAVRGDSNSVPLHEVLRSAVLNAHDEIRRQFPGAGTTLTVAVVLDEMLAIAHVGDSRAYLFHGGKLEQITHDHSLVARLVEIGQQSPEGAASDPRRNYLLRALGQTDALEVDFQFQTFAPGSKLLLCCDGLWGQVEPAALEQMVRDGDDPQAICRNLIRLANDAGGPDNISAVCVIRP